MELNIKERAVIIYNLLWKYDSYTNLQLKESIKSKIDFTDEERSKMTQYVGVDGNSYTQFDESLNLEATRDYEFTEDEILYLADKIIFLNASNRLNEDGMSMYTKVENIYSQIKEEQGFVRIGPWKYIGKSEMNNSLYNG